jgi:hypothetical protein
MEYSWRFNSFLHKKKILFDFFFFFSVLVENFNISENNLISIKVAKAGRVITSGVFSREFHLIFCD